MSFLGTKLYTSLLDSDQTTKQYLRKFSGCTPCFSYFIYSIPYIIKNAECYNALTKRKKCNTEDVLRNKKNHNKIDIYIYAEECACWANIFSRLALVI